LPLTSKERAALRGEAHHLTAEVHVGHAGISDPLVDSLEEALRARELVKVQLNRNVDTPPKKLAADLADRVGAEVVQVIGRTATLYRENPELERRPGSTPPWRR
jgi:RNA-binding protein